MEPNDLENKVKEILNQKLEPYIQTLRDIKDHLDKNGSVNGKLLDEIRALRELIESSNLIRREKIAMFVDSQNLYYSARTAFASKVNYEKLLRLVTGNRALVKAFAYIVQPPEGDVKPFATSLERIGYIVKIKDVRTRSDGSAKANWDMGIALDILGTLDSVDTIVLASGDGDFVALLEFIKGKNKRVEVFSFPDNTAYDLKEKADRFEPLGENVILNLT
jgi:uncharacterized LabA/DUF88 family protein